VFNSLLMLFTALENNVIMKFAMRNGMSMYSYGLSDTIIKLYNCKTLIQNKNKHLLNF
jgi:hypothetical protein